MSVVSDVGSDVVFEVWGFETFEGVEHHHGCPLCAVDLEDAESHAFVHDLLNHTYFFDVDRATGFFDFVDIAEEVGTERTVALYGFFYGIEACEDVFFKFFFGREVFVHNYLQTLDKMVQFVFYHSKIYFVFVAEVGVYGAATFARFVGNVVHGDIGFAVHGEQTACNINDEFAGFGLFVGVFHCL